MKGNPLDELGEEIIKNLGPGSIILSLGFVPAERILSVFDIKLKNPPTHRGDMTGKCVECGRNGFINDALLCADCDPEIRPLYETEDSNR